MCAIVPLTPVVVTLPDTEPSSATVMVPLPLPSVLTAGTSWSPDSVTLTSAASAEAGDEHAGQQCAAKDRALTRHLNYLLSG